MARRANLNTTTAICLLGFIDVCLCSRVPSLQADIAIDKENIHLARQKRLSVLNIVYRKSNVDGAPHNYSRSHSAVLNFVENRPTTTTMETPTTDQKFTVGVSDITATIAKLRTTRMKFSMTTRHTVMPVIDTTEFTPYASPFPTLEMRKVTMISQGLSGQHPPGLVPFSSEHEKVKLTFVPLNPANPRHSQEQMKEPQFFPATRTATADQFVPPNHQTRPETFNRNPLFHELMPTPPRTPSSVASTSPPRSPSTPSPTFQARLNINPARKPTATVPWREPATTGSPSTTNSHSVVTGSPANLSCRGKIGYFSDKTPDCNTFLYCDQFGRSFRFVCPVGTRFNSRMCLCDMHSQCGNAGPIVSADDPCPPLA